VAAEVEEVVEEEVWGERWHWAQGRARRARSAGWASSGRAAYMSPLYNPLSIRPRSFISFALLVILILILKIKNKTTKQHHFRIFPCILGNDIIEGRLAW
jgi:hypothetical protein